MLSKICYQNKCISIFVALTLVVCISACGTIIYPERVGQPKGRIDPGVVVMDGLCLLIVVVPGLVAFIVDFATGAIYLPPGRAAQNDSNEAAFTPIAVIGPQKKNEPDLRRMAEAVSIHTGKSIHLDSADVRLKILEGPASLETAENTLREFAAKN